MVGGTLAGAIAMRIVSLGYGYSSGTTVILYNSGDVTGVTAGSYNVRNVEIDTFVSARLYVPPRRPRGAYVDLLPRPAHRASSLPPAPPPPCAWPAQMRRFRGDA